MALYLRVLIVAVGIALVFAAVVGMLLNLMPGHKTSADHLVIGAIATFVCMIVLFLVLITSWVKIPNVFFRKRDRKTPASE